MKQCFAYIRVSTAKQEEQSASLGEQQSAIQRYADKQGLAIVEWFQEVETAAKRGRPIFTRMVKLLRAGKAEGLIMHKIDRSTRNYHDWAEISDLADRGISVHYANENLELASRGRRLMADIQAVFATDYIRNLREEIQKGINGRLREGLMPWHAPLGYLNNGKGKKKTICPVDGPLVRCLFELYASGRHTLHTLADEAYRLGLRNQRGGRLTFSSLGALLNNPFYIGLINHKKEGAVYKGVHDPLITKSLFDQVQNRLRRRTQQRIKKHVFTYRRLFRCATCGRSLVGERQKGHVYYRCQTKTCPTTCVREEAIEQAILEALTSLACSDKEREKLEAVAVELRQEDGSREEERRELWRCQFGAAKARHDRLVDAYLDGSLDKDTFESRKRGLLLEMTSTQEKLDQKSSKEADAERMRKILELASTALLSHKMGTEEEKREQLQIVTSNRAANGKDVVVELVLPFSLLANRTGNRSGAPVRIRSRSSRKLSPKPRSSRVLRHIVQKIFDWLKEHPDTLEKRPSAVDD